MNIDKSNIIENLKTRINNRLGLSSSVGPTSGIGGSRKNKSRRTRRRGHRSRSKSRRGRSRRRSSTRKAKKSKSRRRKRSRKVK